MAPRFWRQERPSLIARALSPLGALYGAATAIRMSRAGAKVPAPVVCVGNFVVGGAGKTPAAIAIAKLLQSAGERVAFLSRGYGGAARSEPLLVDSLVHNARLVGDEPLLLARVAPCFVGGDRVASARAAIESGASVLVMDDGLQNPALAKNLSFAVVDGEARFGNGLSFPAGPLRAPLAAQSRWIDAVIVIGGGVDARSAEIGAPGKPIFRAWLQPDAIVSAKLVGRSVLAFAGIARPEKFFASLASIGAGVAAARVFADHHLFSPREIEGLIADAAARDLILVTTEKDHVRIAPAYSRDVVALPVTLNFEEPRGVKRLLEHVVSNWTQLPSSRAKRSDPDLGVR
jgi:tetraacyldisaccharide 4'-kinase